MVAHSRPTRDPLEAHGVGHPAKLFIETRLADLKGQAFVELTAAFYLRAAQPKGAGHGGTWDLDNNVFVADLDANVDVEFVFDILLDTGHFRRFVKILFAQDI